MKSLIILRGLVGKEKIDWVRSEGLECFYISLDQLRTLFYRPEQVGSRFALTRSRDDLVYRTFLEALVGRLSTGCLVIVDPGVENTSILEDMATIFGYTVFNKYFNTPWNFEKKYRSYLSNHFLYPTQEQLLKEIDNHKKWKGTNLIKNYQEVELYWREKERKYMVRLKECDQVLHISDVHSNYTLVERILKENLSKVSLTVFLGDYIDGVEKGGSRKMIDLILSYEGNKKFLCLSGNHELRLRKWLGCCWMKVKGRKTAALVLENNLSSDFENRTAQEFNDLTGDDYEGMLRLLNKTLRTHGTYIRGKEKVVCSHAGFSSLNQLSPLFIGNLIYSNRNTDRVDDSFSRNYGNTDLYSVHGHCKYPSGLCFSKYTNVINIDTENEEMVNYFINKDNIWTLKK